MTNGNDLVAAYCRDPEGGGRFFPRPVVEIACRMCDVGDRPQRYSESTLAMNWGFAWNILRAWLWGFGKGKGMGKDE